MEPASMPVTLRKEVHCTLLIKENTYFASRKKFIFTGRGSSGCWMFRFLLIKIEQKSLKLAQQLQVRSEAHRTVVDVMSAAK